MAGVYRPPPPKSASRATANTVCQKCLKRDIYECKANPQDRPYTARPSRTAQLLNPKLLPKLTNDAPNDLLRKTGVADEQLAKQEADRRAEKHSMDSDYELPSRKRSRSPSTASESSVSTISTSASRSPLPSPHKSRHPRHDDEYTTSQQAYHGRSHRTHHTGKRRRRTPSVESYETDYDQHKDRNTRRRRSSMSPVQRGRRRSRSADSKHNGSVKYTRSRSDSRDRRDSRRISRSPYRERDTKNPQKSESRSRSPYRRDRPAPPAERRDWRERRDGDRQAEWKREWKRESSPRMARAPPRERSLSPYSKRIALTQSMNMTR